MADSLGVTKAVAFSSIICIAASTLFLTTNIQKSFLKTPEMRNP
jgi:hypothetical protein